MPEHVKNDTFHSHDLEIAATGTQEEEKEAARKAAEEEKAAKEAEKEAAKKAHSCSFQ